MTNEPQWHLQFITSYNRRTEASPSPRRLPLVQPVHRSLTAGRSIIPSLAVFAVTNSLCSCRAVPTQMNVLWTEQQHNNTVQQSRAHFFFFCWTRKNNPAVCHFAGLYHPPVLTLHSPYPTAIGIFQEDRLIHQLTILSAHCTTNNLLVSIHSRLVFSEDKHSQTSVLLFLLRVHRLLLLFL